MMKFKECIENGKIREVPPHKLRASSLISSSAQAINTAKSIALNSDSSKSILRELYEGLREYSEAIGYIKGYKFLDHESITCFLDEILQEKSLSANFDRYRKLRNGINYYGEDVEIETVKEALTQIPQMMEKLKKHI